MWMNVFYGSMVATFISLVLVKIIKTLMAKLPTDPAAEPEVSTLALEDVELAGLCFYCECVETNTILSNNGHYICRDCSLK